MRCAFDQFLNARQTRGQKCAFIRCAYSKNQRRKRRPCGLLWIFPKAHQTRIGGHTFAEEGPNPRSAGGPPAQAKEHGQ
jgi:hypothetical protein